ncbi:hypothetical protein TREMEDRAFT_30228, partial [Tremella mesenterica DSM 1558]|uniref:uncharacterized protein n=1 Tax=Tremella mesenterica (strain ATCC 24925 / CBS 8224 / DSM 1558 / NBRC 9311 / NRRL Y-6157 / RJB 2259-6 / UBC 559-6) TaxID=578456 RepID=UPI0003F491E1
ELAPGKARIAKVKNWLSEALYGYPADVVLPPAGMSNQSKERIRKYKRILLLTGPAGAGKTTTIRVLAKEMGVELVEWGDSMDEYSVGLGTYHRSHLPPSSLLRLCPPSSSLSSRPDPGSRSPFNAFRPRILFMSSLPNLTHLPTREAFHSALVTFCKTFTLDSCPLVIVHSEAGSGGRAEESWMDREGGGREGAVSVVGKEVLGSPYCQEIDFIPLAPTFITKALSRVLDQAIPDVKQRPPHSAVQLIALSANGDLRSAINSLQMLCGQNTRLTGNKRKRKNRDIGSGSSKTGRGSRGGKGARIDVSDDLRAVLDIVAKRENSLNLFHSLGKVFYNKRQQMDFDPRIDEEDQEVVATVRALAVDDPLPSHLEQYQRSKSLVQAENFLPTISVDASTFSLWLHQSLPSFCTDIDQVAEAYDDLCRADMMRTDDDIWQSSPQAIAYALHIVVRGCLLALPSPVPRRNNQKVIKPQWFDAYRSERENSSRINMTWASLAKQAIKSSSIASDVSLHETLSESTGWGGIQSRSILATETIPMMLKLEKLHNRPLLPPNAQNLSLPPYATFIRTQSLDERDTNEEEEEPSFKEEVMRNWEEDEEEEETSWLKDDEIEDWD